MFKIQAISASKEIKTYWKRQIILDFFTNAISRFSTLFLAADT